MTAKPQFEHKSPGVSAPIMGRQSAYAGLVTAYNNAVFAPAAAAGGNDGVGFGLTAGRGARGAPAGGDPGQMGIPQ
jgi:hypothetical protein